MSTKSTNNDNPIAQAMADMPACAPQDAQNAFKKYRYASADSIYQTVRPALTKAGLSIWQNEVGFEILDPDSKGVRFVKAQYAFAFVRDLSPPEESSCERVTVMAQFVDAQTLQALRTYALKYWLRGKFLLATGEVDADLDGMASSAPPARAKNRHSQNGQAQERPTPPHWRLDKESLKYHAVGDFAGEKAKDEALVKCLLTDFKVKQRSPEQLSSAQEVVETNIELIETLPQAAQEKLFARFEEIGIWQNEAEPA